MGTCAPARQPTPRPPYRLKRTQHYQGHKRRATPMALRSVVRSLLVLCCCPTVSPDLRISSRTGASITITATYDRVKLSSRSFPLSPAWCSPRIGCNPKEGACPRRHGGQPFPSGHGGAPGTVGRQLAPGRGNGAPDPRCAHRRRMSVSVRRTWRAMSYAQSTGGTLVMSRPTALME
jgi:hypothetical protein